MSKSRTCSPTGLPGFHPSSSNEIKAKRRDCGTGCQKKTNRGLHFLGSYNWATGWDSAELSLLHCCKAADGFLTQKRCWLWQRPSDFKTASPLQADFGSPTSSLVWWTKMCTVHKCTTSRFSTLHNAAQSIACWGTDVERNRNVEASRTDGRHGKILV